MSFGVFYGVGDQTIYFPPGLHLADVSFLEKDWYASEVTSHHQIFAYIVWGLSKLGPIALTSAILNLLLMVAIALSTYAIINALYKSSLKVFLFFLIILHLVVGSSLLSHPFLVPWLLPTGMASIFFLCGVALLTQAYQGPLFYGACSGFVFGLSGAVHGTFLFLVPLFLLGVLIVLRRHLSFRILIVFGIPYLAIMLPVGWPILDMFVFQDKGENVIALLDQFARFRIPHHHLPNTWDIDIFVPFGAHLLLGFIGLLVVQPKGAGSPVVLAAAVVLMGILIVLILCTVVVFVPRVALLQAFRFVALLSYFSLLFFAGAIIQTVEYADKFSWAESILLLCLGLLFYLDYAVAAFLICLSWVLIGIRYLFPQGRRFVTGIVFCCVTLFLIFQIRERFPLSHDALVPLETKEAVFFKWIRDYTPEDALFVVPFNMKRFRLHAQRSIVVDWKGFPFRVDDAQEWLHRLSLVSGVPNPITKSSKALFEGYRYLDAERAQKLSKIFGVQFFVIQNPGHQGNLSALDLFYNQDGYAVYRIDPDIQLVR